MPPQKIVGFLLGRVDCNDGIASHCETLMRGLKHEGWKIVLITGKVGFDDSSLQRFEALKELAEEWIVIDDFKRMFPNWKSISRVISTVKKYKIQVFHAHGYSMLTSALVFKIFTDIRCVTTFHSLKSIYLGKSPEGENLWLQQFLLKIYLRIFSPHIFIAISSDIEQWLIRGMGIAKSKIRKVFNGIDSRYFHLPNYEERRKARAKFNLSEQDFTIALVGRTQWEKGHKLVIDTVNQIAERSGSSVRCIFAGSGDHREEIENYALSSSGNHHRFNFLGYINETRDLYWASDVIVLPSQAEGFPLVIVEAMACGVVTIRTPAAGAYDQIEDGVNGFIIPFNDLEALSSRLLQLSDNAELRSHLAKNSLKASQKFTLETMTSGTIAAYKEAST